MHKFPGPQLKYINENLNENSTSWYVGFSSASSLSFHSQLERSINVPSPSKVLVQLLGLSVARVSSSESAYKPRRQHAPWLILIPPQWILSRWERETVSACLLYIMDIREICSTFSLVLDLSIEGFERDLFRITPLCILREPSDMQFGRSMLVNSLLIPLIHGLWCVV